MVEDLSVCVVALCANGQILGRSQEVFVASHAPWYLDPNGLQYYQDASREFGE
jgi:hypothetical protein